MQIQRLSRLMSIISDIRRNHASNMDDLCSRFSISRRQFYNDRNALSALGYEFHFSRKRGRLVLDAQPENGEWPCRLSPDELMSLILAVKAAIQADSLTQILTAIAGLEKITAALPPRFKKFFAPAIKQLLWDDGLKISAAMLDELMTCIQEGRRIVALMFDEQQPLILDPKGLALYQGTLCLCTPSLPPDHPAGILLPDLTPPSRGLALARVRKIVPTPFFSPTMLKG
jgi:predicted DNA-binding transcriptional regulator YafY